MIFIGTDTTHGGKQIKEHKEVNYSRPDTEIPNDP